VSSIVNKYKNINSRLFSKIHQMTAYLAMFPPNLPYVLINDYSKEGDIVYDPFCGRGTVVFEACRLGRIGVGNDLNPLAYVLTQAKANLPNKFSIFKRINELEKNYTKPDISNIPEEITMLFDIETTLPQLEYLKQTLNKKRKIDIFILAILTGILHGKMRKDGTSIYCSIDMPNTFSMSPNYVKNFIQEHKLIPPKQNVFYLLKNRVESIFNIKQNYLEYQSLTNYVKGKVFNVDAIEASKKIEKTFGKNSVKLIITSPPYLKVINYGKYNWIRLWLLDENKELVDKKVTLYHKLQNQKLSDNLNLEEYSKYMFRLFSSWKNILKDDGYAFVVIGDVKSKNSTLNLAKTTWENIEKMGGCGLKLVDILEDNIENNGKQIKVTKIWGKKKGDATKIDRILILRKDKKWD
jgi:DNA modification methylase